MDISEFHLCFRPIQYDDGPEVIEIFNHYIKFSDAAFPEKPVSEDFFENMRAVIDHYPSVAVRTETGTLVGFGMLKPHNPFPAFRHTGEITYFIRDGWTGKGIGRHMLDTLVEEGKRAGLLNILAEISSKNEGSIRFHQNTGFFECGRFRNVGHKKGQFFDTVWMQKEI